MTNDPSMTITSTTPAPDAPPPDMVKTVGGTTFDIYFHFSQTMRSVLIGFEYPCGTLRIMFAQNPIRQSAPGSS